MSPKWFRPHGENKRKQKLKGQLWQKWRLMGTAWFVGVWAGAALSLEDGCETPGRRRPGSVAPSQAADGQPDCSHIRREDVSADERSRPLTFALKETQFSQLVWLKNSFRDQASAWVSRGAKREVVQRSEDDDQIRVTTFTRRNPIFPLEIDYRDLCQSHLCEGVGAQMH